MHAVNSWWACILIYHIIKGTALYKLAKAYMHVYCDYISLLTKVVDISVSSWTCTYKSSTSVLSLSVVCLRIVSCV